MLTTYGLLGLAIATVWLRPLPLGRFAVPIWVPIFIAAILSGFYFDYLSQIGIAVLAAYATLAKWASRPTNSRPLKVLLTLLVVIFGLALATHKLPGFSNPVLVSDYRFSPDGVPFTQYANFDKGSVGLILLAFFCPRAVSFADFLVALRRSAHIILLTVLLVISIAWGAGYVRFDPKWGSYTLVFLSTNLVLTVIAEQAFFRGLLQERLLALFSKFRFGAVSAILITSILFGLVHASGGAALVFLALIAGIGHACAYNVARRIEVAVLAHFAVNTVHFLAFTYPRIA